MSRLHLLILWILAIGAGFLYLKSKGDPSASASPTKLETGSSLLPADLIDTIDEFKYEKDGQSVTLKKIDEQWLVTDQENYPASFNKLTNAFDALRSAKVGQGVPASSEYHNRFNLDPEVEAADQRPATITLMTGGEESGKLLLGKSREATGGSSETAGRFVRIAGDDTGVYIVQQSFANLSSDSSTWIDQEFSPLKQGLIKISASAPQDGNFQPWTISRKTVMDDFIVEGLQGNQEPQTNVTSSLKSVLGQSTFLKLLSADQAKELSDAKRTREFTATDSSGSSFLITLTPEKKKREEKKEAAAPDQPAAPTPVENYIATLKVLNGPTKPEAPAADANTQAKAVFEQRVANLAEVSAQVNLMKKKFEGRHFLMNKAPIASLLKNRGEFIKTKEVERKPATVTTPPVRVPTPGTDPGNAARNPAQGSPLAPPPSIARPTEVASTNQPKAQPKPQPQPQPETSTPPTENTPAENTETPENGFVPPQSKPQAQPQQKTPPTPEAKIIAEPSPEQKSGPKTEADSKQESEAQAKARADRKAKKAAERKAKWEAERKVKQEQKRKAKQALKEKQRLKQEEKRRQQQNKADSPELDPAKESDDSQPASE